MSALRLQKVAHNQGGQCCEPSCSRMGRHTIEIAGWFVMQGGLMTRKATLCKPCAEAERERWDELAAGPETLAVAALASAPSDRAHAIWFLREECGHSAEAVAAALADTARGHGIDRVLDYLNDSPLPAEVC